MNPIRHLTSALAPATMFLAAPMANACPVCSGAAESPMIDGARMGVWLLIGVTAAVQLAFVVFFFGLRRRARLAAVHNPAADPNACGKDSN